MNWNVKIGKELIQSNASKKTHKINRIKETDILNVDIAQG